MARRMRSSNWPKIGIQSGIISIGEMIRTTIAIITFLSREGILSSFETLAIKSFSLLKKVIIGIFLHVDYYMLRSDY